MRKISREELMDKLCIRLEDIENYLIPLDVLEEFVPLFNKTYWNFISYYQPLSEDFVTKYAKDINWRNLMKRDKFNKYSDAFLVKNRKYIHREDFDFILTARIFSEKTLLDFKFRKNNSRCWSLVSRYQPLSKNFIQQNIEAINVDELLRNGRLSKDVKEEVLTLAKLLGKV